MLELKNINITFDEFSVTNLSIAIKQGDYYVILGESGAGKSMILELIAGIIKAESGRIFLNNEDISDKNIQKREIGIVFQDYAVFPHMNVFNNIAYPLKNNKLSKKEIKNKVIQISEELDISHLLNRKTTNLSGGELQRTALARTLVLNPKVLLLDEPLVALDVSLKESLRNFLRKLHKKGQTIIHVTHDFEEAVSLANKIAVIHKGKLLQEGKPSDVFNNPQSEFTAHFTGNKNFYDAEYISEQTIRIKNTINIIANPSEIMCKGYVILPADTLFISLEKPFTSAVNNFEGTIKSIVPSRFGKEIIIDIGINVSVLITEKSFQNFNLEEGKYIWLSFKANSVRFIPKN